MYCLAIIFLLALSSHPKRTRWRRFPNGLLRGSFVCQCSCNPSGSLLFCSLRSAPSPSRFGLHIVGLNPPACYPLVFIALDVELVVPHMQMFVCQSDASMHGLLPRRNRVRCIGVRSPHLSCHDLGMESWLGLKRKDRPTRRWSAFPLSNRHRNLWHLIGGRDRTEDPTGESIRRRGKDALGSHTVGKLGTSAFPLRVTLVSRDSVLLPIIPIDGRSLCPAPPEPILCKSCSFGCFLADLPQPRNPDYPFRVEESPPECLTTPLSSQLCRHYSGDIQTTGYIGKGRSCVRGVS